MPFAWGLEHIGEDPAFSRYPMRSFPSDLAVQAGPTQALEALARAVEPRLQMADARVAARRARLTDRMRTRRAQLAKDSAAGATISPEYLSRAIGEAVGKDAIIGDNATKIALADLKAGMAVRLILAQSGDRIVATHVTVDQHREE